MQERTPRASQVELRGGAAESKPTRSSITRIAGFDGVRAIAFLLVFISHKLTIPHHHIYGSVGVWTFFVLSGLLITSILSEMREQVEAGLNKSWRAVRDFYLRRSARIFPLYYACLAIFALASIFTHFDGFSTLDASVYAIYGTDILFGAMPQADYGHFGHLWSLSVEEQFYLVFAPLLLFSPRKYLAHICVVFIGMAVVTKVMLELSGMDVNAVYVNPMVNFGLLALGGLIAAGSKVEPPRWLVSWPAQAASGLALLAIPIFLGGYRDTWNHWAMLVGLIAGLFLFQIARAQSTPVVRFLDWWPLRTLGRVSYGTYLFHQFVHFYNIESVLHKLHINVETPFPIQVAVELAVTILLATFSWHFFERPILQWAARVTPREGRESSHATAVLAPEQATG